MSQISKPGSIVNKDPHAVNDAWGMDWTDYLAELGAGAAIDSSTWLVDGPDALLVVASSEVLTGGLVAQVYLSGGTVGAKYRVTNRIVTNTTPSVTDDRSFRVFIKEL